LEIGNIRHGSTNIISIQDPHEANAFTGWLKHSVGKQEEPINLEQKEKKAG